jgi:amidase
LSNLTYCTATELAQRIRAGEASATEVVEAFLTQIARHNQKLNAIVLVDEEGARRRAEEADAALARGEVWGPLHGVPVTIKDAYETAGLRTTSGYEPLANYVPQQDATMVARMRAAGAIILGKTNTSRLAADMQTNSRLLGRANNPWNLERTTGGSCGGEAAAIAAGLSPLGFGGDLAGSIRLPVHFCGILGMKATEGRIAKTGSIPPLPVPGAYRTTRHMVGCGPLARSVADLRLCLSIIAGPDEQDYDAPPVSLNSDISGRRLSQYKVAWTDNFGDAPLSADTRTALSRLADDLERAGYQVEHKNHPPDFEFQAAWETFGKLLGFMLGMTMPMPQRIGFRLLGRSLFKDPMMSTASRVMGLDMRQYFKTLAQREVLIAALEDFLQDYDAWLCPVAPGPAFVHCKPGPIGEPVEIDGQRVPYWTACASYTAIFSLTGNPVVVLPLAQSIEGLPIGVQVVGRRWDDMALLDVAEALMEVIGPVRRPPGY